MIRLTEIADRSRALELVSKTLNVPMFDFMELRGGFHGRKREVNSFCLRKDFENARRIQSPISQHILAVEFIWVGSRYFQITWQ